jgi:membrane-associated phospholipid phosphatase
MTAHLIIKLLADGTIIPIVLIAGYALLFKIPIGQRYELYVRIIMAGMTAYLIAKLLGSIYQPVGERPFEVLGVQAGASILKNPGFPSDHALFATFLTLAVWFTTRQRTLSLILVVLTIMVGVGRVLALVHTPLDIIGGIVVASIGALWYLEDGKNQLHQPLAKTTKN